MAYFAIIPLFLTLCGVTFGGYVDSNLYVDNVLSSLRSQPGLDPYNLEDFVYEFKDKIKIIGTVKGKATYEKGELKGLSSVSRKGDCSAPLRRFGGTEVELNCTIAFEKLETSYHGQLKYGKTPKVNIKAKGEFGTTLVLIVIKQKGPYTAPVLDRLDIKQLGSFKATFTGLGPLNKFLSILKENYTSTMNAQMINALNKHFVAAVNRALMIHTQMPQY